MVTPEEITETAFAYRQMLESVAVKITGDHDLAGDIFAETVVLAIRKRHTFKGGSLLRVWLYRIAYNRSLETLRGRRRYKDMVDIEDVELVDPRTDALAGLLRGENSERVRAAVDRLCGPQKDVVYLRYWEDMSVAEIAVATSSTVAAVKSHLHRARLELQEALR